MNLICERCQYSNEPGSISCAFCYFDANKNWPMFPVPVEPAPDPVDYRVPIAEMFEERANNEALDGNWTLAHLWRQAAELSRGFIYRPGPR